jgi:hypothetical protein
MNERARRAAPLLLVLALAAAWQLPDLEWTRLATPASEATEGMTAAIDGLPDDPSVLLAFDPDLGTYAEVRPTARALVADLLAREASIAFVSVTAEGRALALAELARLGREDADAARIVDLGFVAGAEAGLVDLTRTLRPVAGDADTELGRELEAGGIAAFDAVAVIGGNDLGPRSWIEQVGPRIDDVPIVAVAPTVQLPEIQPYLDGGQLAAALATPRDGAAYRASLEAGADPAQPPALPILVGMLVAVGVLGQGLTARLLDSLRVARAREAG